MSEAARDVVLERLRRVLGRRGPGASEARDAVQDRLAKPPAGLIPARGELGLEGRIQLFTAEAEAVQTTVRRLRRYEDVADAIERYLRERNLPMRLVIASDPLLSQVGWSRTMLTLRTGRAVDDDAVGLTVAFAGIAETGTLMLCSAPETPTTLAFLPETSIVLLPAARVLRAYEDGLRLLREERGSLPRSINFITGPSRSGDIEQTLQLGAHGPRRLHVLLVDELIAAGGAGRRP
ncbi:MAG TPA: LUD domain-containing protein [Geminicoccaceae bacterium]|nr:LUD domain-containing protein [Geminicoccaceae bacterium]